MGMVMAFRKVSSEELDFLRSASAEGWQGFEARLPDNESDAIDIDKSWDGIHWVLTGRSSAAKPLQIGAVFGNIMQSLMGQFAADNAKKADSPKESEVLNWAIAKGIDFDQDLQDFGQPTYIPSDKVLAVAQALNEIKEEELKNRFVPQEMAAGDVYLSKFWSRDTEQGWQYLIENYRTLKDFFVAAAAENKAVIRYLC